MGTEMQFTTDGVIHQTLDVIPYDNFMDSAEVAIAMDIEENVSSARLKLLFDNGVVFRQKAGGRFQYTRSRNLELPLAEKTEVKIMDKQLNSSRHTVAEFLKKNIGNEFTVDTIVSVTGVGIDEVIPMMHDLKHSGYVAVTDDGSYEVLEDINGYRPNKNRRAVRAKKPAPLAPVNIADAIVQMQAQNDDYRAALCLIRETIDSVLGDHPCQTK